MQQLVNGWFLLFVGLYLTHSGCMFYGYSTPFLRSYFGDILALPIILYLSTLVLRFILQKPGFNADITMLISLWALLSLVFEVFLPSYYPRYTADFWDVIAYGVGALLAYVAFVK